MNMLIQVELILEAVLGISAFTYVLGGYPTAFPAHNYFGEAVQF